MKNKYFVVDDRVHILFKYKGYYSDVIIDKSDFELVNSFNGTWGLCGGNYVGSSITVNGKKQQISLHRFIMSTPKGLVVDHINHEIFDNRRENLRNVTSTINGLNKIGPQSNNKSSGILGVTWDKNAKSWAASVQVSRKRKHLGNFKRLEDAKRIIEQYRSQLDFKKIQEGESA